MNVSEIPECCCDFPEEYEYRADQKLVAALVIAGVIGIVIIALVLLVTSLL